MYKIILVFLGGGLGSVARYGISEFVKSNCKTAFPIATLFSNILSCLILALVVGIFSEKIGNSNGFKALLVIGFCGGFSTFSSFSFETVELIKSGNVMIAFANILISISVCIALVYFLVKN